MHVYQEMSGRKEAPTVDALAELHIAADKMEARLVIRPPGNQGADLTHAQLSEALARGGVVFGVKAGKLAELADNPIYNRPVVVAEGQRGVAGTDAALVYHVNLERDLSPKMRPDGSVDFKDLNIMEKVSRGDVLCEKTPSTKGKPGIDVFGVALAAKPGKDVALVPGKNTALSEDKLRLLSSIDGQVTLAGKKLIVLDVFTVDGDVSHATGNIRFSGHVVVTGNVLAGFSIEAGGNVDIYGTVDQASVSAGGILMVRGGFNGGRTGELISGSKMSCRFIQGGRITVGEDLEATYILNATVLCSGSINVTGKGLIVGGRVAARSCVTVNTLGNANTSAGTIVEVGNDASLVKRAQEIPKKLASMEKTIRSLEVSLKTLIQRKATGRLTEDNAETLEKVANSYHQMKSEQAALQAELAAAQEEIAKTGQGVVKVLGKAYPGVRIIIGTHQLLIQSECTFTMFKRSDEGIVSAPAR